MMKCLNCCKCRETDVIVGGPSEQHELMNGDDQHSADKQALIVLETEESSLYYISAESEEENDVSVKSDDFFFDAAADELSSIDIGHTLLKRQDITADEDKLLLGDQHVHVSRSSEEWGFPGFLTRHQLEAFQEFRDQVNQRGGVYKEMVYCYSEIEEEAYALCRFLRWANFHVPKVFRYIDSHVEQWNVAKRRDFYPNGDIGAPLSVLLTQFPSVYAGFAKEGFPVCYFKMESLSVEGIDCVTDVERLPNFIWFNMMHDVKRIYKEAISRHPTMKRLEQITVMNLEGLSPRLVTSRTFAVSQQADAVAQIFPEMMYRLVIINAPRFFTYIWKSFKVLLDPNTTKRIELYSSRQHGMKRLLQLIDLQELPSDYGGMGISTSQAILREGRAIGAPVPLRQIVKLLKIHRHDIATLEFELSQEEEISIAIYTRSESHTEFVLQRQDNDNTVVKQITVFPTGEKRPYCVHFVEAIRGSGQYSIVGRHAQGHSSTEHFLVVGEMFAAKDE